MSRVESVWLIERKVDSYIVSDYPYREKQNAEKEIAEYFGEKYRAVEFRRVERKP
jgi:hypothetical protein